MILQARAVDFSYDDGTRALDQASLVVNRREIMAILGANGAGKSTLLSTLNGTFKPAAGEVLLNGNPVSYSRKGLVELRSQVGLVLQDPDDQLFAATVFEDVSFGPLNLGLSVSEARTRVQEALAVMGIEALSHRPTHLLSFGQRKRVAIAGVLAMSPAVLLLDEPTAGLDPKSVDELCETLRSLATQGVAVVIATHDMDIAYNWADQVAVFARGKIIMEGRAEHVFGESNFQQDTDLRLPLIYQLSSELRNSGLISQDGDLPRSVPELVQQLRARQG
ncbi:energy-coupling factor ABC transporter ATP-binding protein [Rhizobium sp. SL42]|uniref:energy-coupling factor ABC transporter ATP-binding protein n=1 Tax=Rhizobium sp. SL42 TaxID=2806346 RepID=UPI001F026632|nr:ATP-binding cassette domain-containing protein [Rhizobium sp. SL42]UJW77231.1 ATP-binding cassette domain-containing protein [Rhizobium sp. SL42]